MAKFNTFYRSGAFGVSRQLIRDDATFGTRPYAQYTAAPFVEFTEKGKRTRMRATEGYRPYMLIIAGEGPAVPDLFVTTDGAPGVTCRITRFASCDAAATLEFDAMINEYIAANPGCVLFDARTPQG